MTARRSYGTGSLITRNGNYYGKWWINDRQVMRKIGLVRTPHKPDGMTKTQAEAHLRDLIQTARAAAPMEHARTLGDAADAWLTHKEATGVKASSIRADRAALDKWFLPTLKTRSLDRITTADVEHAITRMRKAKLSDKTIRNYVGTLRALINYARDKRRRWASRNPVDDVELPRAPVYSEIRYLTTDEIWALVEAVKAIPITGTGGMTYEALDKAMIVTAAMTGLRIGELQALDWRGVDFVHARIRVRRTWDRKAKTFTKPKSRRSERAVPMPDEVAGHLERLLKTYEPETVEPDPDALVFGHPVAGDPLGHRLMYERLRAALKHAGLDESFAWHNLRHSYGTALAAQGVPMRTIQEWMGHKDVQTTQRYADYCPNPGERDVVEAAFARSSTNPSTNLRSAEQN